MVRNAVAGNSGRDAAGGVGRSAAVDGLVHQRLPDPGHRDPGVLVPPHRVDHRASRGDEYGMESLGRRRPDCEPDVDVDSPGTGDDRTVPSDLDRAWVWRKPAYRRRAH